jgi:hypothetical protein
MLLNSRRKSLNRLLKVILALYVICLSKAIARKLKSSKKTALYKALIGIIRYQPRMQ